MSMLETQQAMMAALLHGPASLPARLFAGDAAAVHRGMRVHANTISHARLVALEDSFPRTRAWLGEAEFNRLSRRYAETLEARRLPLTRIGLDFAAAMPDPVAADLARVEWAWLESYHAADAAALTLSDLAGYDEAGLLGLTVRRHPAVRIIPLLSASAPMVEPGFATDTAALLVTRPDADVRLFAIETADVAALTLSETIHPLGNVIALLAERHSGGGAAIGSLIAAGAFIRGEDE